MSKLTLTEWRRAKKVTQQQLADGIGVHVNTITRWEGNPDIISLGDAKKICTFLNLQIDDVDFLRP